MTDSERERPSNDDLIERLEHLERVIQSNTARLFSIERHLRLEDAPPARIPASDSAPRFAEDAPTTTMPVAETTTPSSPSQASSSVSQSNFSTAHASSSEASERRRVAGKDEEAPPAGFESGAGPKPSGATAKSSGATASSSEARDFETIVGGSWFNWAGVLALAFAVAFFLKHAFDKQWISPVVRVGLGAVAGATLLAVGGRLRERGLRQYAFVLSGGGILILYLAIYAAFNFYRLLNQSSAFLLMVAVTVTAVLLAVRWDAWPIAVLGLVGGFNTPVLLSTGSDNQVALFTYIALLDAGVLALAYLKGWRALNFLAFTATCALSMGWLAVHYQDSKLWTTLAFFTLFFLIYTALAPLHNLLPRRAAEMPDLMLIVFNTSIYFGVSYLLLVEAGHEVRLPASHALLLSALFTGLFYAAWNANREDRLLSYAYVGAAATLLTVALAIQLELHWVTVAWAAEALALLWVGVRARESAVRHAALLVFALAVFHWFIWDLWADFFTRRDALLLNRRIFSCAALIAAMAVAAWLYRRASGVSESERTLVAAGAVVVGNFLALTALSVEAISYFELQIRDVRDFSVPFDSPRGAEIRARVRELTLARELTLSVVWALYGACLLLVGRVRRAKLLRVMALFLLSATTMKVFFWDLASLDRAYRIVSFIVLGLILLAVSYLYQKTQQRERAAREAEG